MGASVIIASPEADTQFIVISMSIAQQDIYHSFLRKDVLPTQFFRLSHFMSIVVGSIALLFALLIPDIVQLAINALPVLLIFLPATLGMLFWKRATASTAFGVLLVVFF